MTATGKSGSDSTYKAGGGKRAGSDGSPAYPAGGAERASSNVSSTYRAGGAERASSDPGSTYEAGGAERASGDARGGAGEALRSAAEQVTEQAKEKAGELKRKAKETAHEVGDRARSVVDQQKHAAVGRVEGIAHALRTASDELRDQGQPMVAEYSRYAAEGLESMAQSLDRREIGDFVDGVEQFARERPIAFLGGAMVAGFALARFMKSSSTRRDRPEDRSDEPRPATHGAAASPAGATTTPGVWTPNTPSPRAGG
jgi:hypothetical protein